MACLASLVPVKVMFNAVANNDSLSLWQPQHGVEAEGAIQAARHNALWAAGQPGDHVRGALPGAPESL